MHKRHFFLAAVAATVALLAGCATPSGRQSVAEVMAAQPQLSTLNQLVTQAGLAPTLKADGPFTVFAPDNAAFAQLPAATLQSLASDPAKLKALLSYHVVPAKLTAADVKNASSPTLNGAKVALAKAGSFVTVEDALVTTPDLAATNGVVHIVDSVLMPPASR